MLGAIAGDVIGSPYEWRASHSTAFPLFAPESRFTDDTVLTVATAQAILTRTSYADAYHSFGNRYPNAGYGGAFQAWLRQRGRKPYGSWGNGSAMRVSPVGLAGDSFDEVLAEAERSAAVTHDHPDGIRGAKAVAGAVFLARTGATKDTIRERIIEVTGYDLSRTVAEIRPTYSFDVSCQGSVPEAITAFLEADDVEQAIRNAISLGGDSDTQGAIAGGMAEAFWGGVPAPIAEEVRRRLPAELLDVIDAFEERYPVGPGRGRPAELDSVLRLAFLKPERKGMKGTKDKKKGNDQ